MILSTLDDFFFGDQKRKLIVLGSAILLGQATAISSTQPGGTFIAVAVIATMGFAVLAKLVYDWVAVARFAVALADFGTALVSLLRVAPWIALGVYLFRSPENLSLLGASPIRSAISGRVLDAAGTFALLVLIAELVNRRITTEITLLVHAVKRAIQSRTLTRSQGRLLSRLVLRRVIVGATSGAVSADHLARDIEEIRELNATLETTPNNAANRPAP